MIGTQSGSVISVTSTLPSSNESTSSAEAITCTAPAAIACADREPGDEQLAGLVEVVRRERPGAGVRLHGLGAGLDDEQLAGAPVLGPLDVHRALVVRLDRRAPAGEREHLVVVEDERAALLVAVSTLVVGSSPASV